MEHIQICTYLTPDWLYIPSVAIVIILFRNFVKHQDSPRKFEFTKSKSNLWIYFYIVLKKTEKFTGPNKVLLVLGLKIGAHREDCQDQEKILVETNLYCLRN